MSKPRSQSSGLWPFRGGLRLRHWKQLSIAAPLKKLPASRRYDLLLKQHPGPPAAPLVSVGDRVSAWQPVATTDHALAAPLHAPCDATVVGVTAERIELERIEQSERPQGLPPFNYQTTSPEAVTQRIHDCGIVGLGGASFPTRTKVGDPKPVELLIVNGTECEPYISSDEMLMRERPEQVVDGTLTVLRAVRATKAIIAVEDRLHDVIAGFQDVLTRRSIVNVSIKGVPARFPEGGERQLVQILTGVEVPSGQHPPDIGILCHNVATLAAVDDACARGKPLVSRVVSVTGRGVREPCNLEVDIGTPVRELIAAAGGYTPDAARLVAGGPMTGTALASDDVPVAKGTNCVLVLIGRDVDRDAPTLPCIRCGECARVCPAGLLPQELYWHLHAKETQRADDLHLRDCILCGCCAQVCPSHIPLVQYYRAGKLELAELWQQRDEAQEALQRFNIHEARAERDAREQESARVQHQDALASSDDPQAVIAAMVDRANRRKPS